MKFPSLAPVSAVTPMPADTPSSAASDFAVPYEKYKLANGMRVILSEDHAVPVVAVYVLYDVGARVEQKGRTGFAHLFEHMMFQGSKNAPKGMHFKTVESNGGTLNGSTHPDYTDYFEILPSNKLPVALWLEADRMRGLDITEANLTNQKDAVKQERRLSFDNQPYNTALVDVWPQLAFRNWQSSHSLIGSFEDLNSATVDDVARFFRTYYAPNNAILAIVGDISVPEAKKWVETYFGDIPAQPQPPRPDMQEPPFEGSRKEVYRDALAQVPGVILGYPGPVRRSPDYYALVMADIILTGGDSSRLHQALVKGQQSVVRYEGNPGWPFQGPSDYKDPNTYALFLLHKPNFTGTQVVAQVQEQIDRLASQAVDARELARAQTQLRASRIQELQSSIRRATLLAQYEMFDARPEWITEELAQFTAVTPAQVQAVAKKYLTESRRAVLEIVPSPKAAEKESK